MAVYCLHSLRGTCSGTEPLMQMETMQQRRCCRCSYAVGAGEWWTVIIYTTGLLSAIHNQFKRRKRGRSEWFKHRVRGSSGGGGGGYVALQCVFSSRIKSRNKRTQTSSGITLYPNGATKLCGTLCSLQHPYRGLSDWRSFKKKF